MKTTYEVYRPIVSGAERISTGRTQSRHRTPEAADAAIRRANQRLRRQPGQATSWLDLDVRARDGQHSRRLTDSETERITQARADDLREAR